MTRPLSTREDTPNNNPLSSGLSALIEQLYADECSSPQKTYAIASDYQAELTRIFVLPCGKWTCPECGERNRKTWMHDVMYGVSWYMETQNMEFSLLTLTLSGRNRSRQSSISAWRSVWPRLFSRHYRKYGSCPYVLVPEMHRNGVVHLHAIVSSPTTKRWWKDNCYACGGGYIADFELCRDERRAGAYATKYLGKNLAVHNWPKGYRRIRTSRYWPKVPRSAASDNYEWKVIHPGQLDWLVTYHYGIGMDVRFGWSNLTVDEP